MVEYVVSTQTDANDTMNKKACIKTMGGRLPLVIANLISSMICIPVSPNPTNEKSKSVDATFPTMNEMSKLRKFFLWRLFSFKSNDFIDFVLNQYASNTRPKLYKLKTIIEKANNIKILRISVFVKNAFLKG
jgi:hypothetical protein